VRRLAYLLVLAASLPSGGLAASPGEMQALEQAWHRCLREAQTHQPPGQSRAGDTRNTLDECKEHEDAFVAALMSDRPASLWARAWAAVVEPLTTWIGAPRR